MTDEKKPAPMYFASLRLSNVKSFNAEQILDLRDHKGLLSRWTLILGDNGVGKTTLLKCLAWMFPVKFPEDERIQSAKRLRQKSLTDVKLTPEFIQEVSGISEKEWKMISSETQNGEEEVKRIKPLMDNFDNESEFNAVIRVGKGVKMNIEVELANAVPLNTVPDDKNLIKIGITLARKNEEEVDEIEDIVNTDHLTTAEVEEFNTPNLFAYGAARHMALENIETLPKNPAFNLFSTSGDLYDAEEVLTQLYTDSVEEENVALKKGLDGANEGKATRHLNKIKDILTKLLPHVENPDCIIINRADKKDGLPTTKTVEVVTPFGKVGLYDLSLGYQTMLAWVVDLAIRMFWQNPESDNPLDEPAVVIVDEIDLHLHPKWQRTLKEYLTANFQATQFICTAHSPFIAQASEDENLCVLHERKLDHSVSEVHIENDPTIVKGWRIGQIVTNLFGVPETSVEVEKLRKRRREIIDNPNHTSDDEVELKTINDQLLKIPSGENAETHKLLDEILIAAETLKKEGKLK